MTPHPHAGAPLATFPDVLKDGIWDGRARTLTVSPSLFSEMEYARVFAGPKWDLYVEEKLLPVFGRGEVRVVVDYSRGAP